jgi:hypothetical protein
MVTVADSCENIAAERDGLAAGIVRIVGSGRGECTGERNIAGRAAAARDREYIVRRTGLAFLLCQGERSAVPSPLGSAKIYRYKQYVTLDGFLEEGLT